MDTSKYTSSFFQTGLYKRSPFKMVDVLVLKEFLRAFVFIFALFIAIAFVLILFQELDVILTNSAPFGISLIFVLLSIPHELMKAAPMMVVISVVLSIGNMLRHNEILMLYIAGYSPLRIGAPLAVMLSGLILFLFWMNEEISAPFSQKAHELLETRIKKGTLELSGDSGIWLHGEDNQVYFAQSFFPQSNTVNGMSIFEFNGPNRTISRRLFAEKASWDGANGWWVMQNVVDHIIQEDGSVRREIKDSLNYIFKRSPQDFGRVTLNPEQMSYSDLSRIVRAIRRAGENPIQYLPDLHIKIAFPFAVFFLGLLSYGMILRYGMGASASGIGIGLLAAIAYFMFLSLGKSFARANSLAPWLGAWLPNIVCFAITVKMFFKLRDDV